MCTSSPSKISTFYICLGDKWRKIVICWLDGKESGLPNPKVKESRERKGLDLHSQNQVDYISLYKPPKPNCKPNWILPYWFRSTYRNNFLFEHEE